MVNIKRIIFFLILIILIIFSRNKIINMYDSIQKIFSYSNFKLVEYRSKIFDTAINFKERVVLVSNIDEYIKKNKELEAKLENELLNIENIEELKKENAILKETLELKTKIKYETIAVEVKLSEILDEDILYITKGSNDGIKLNQLVIYSGNMIGKISKVEKNYSEVTLLTNKNSKISVIMNDSYLTVIRGNGNGTFSVKNYNNDIDIDNENNFSFKTSGISDIIIKNINIGTFSIKEKSLFKKTKELIFQPTYRYGDIRIVLVLKEVKE